MLALDWLTTSKRLHVVAAKTLLKELKLTSRRRSSTNIVMRSVKERESPSVIETTRMSDNCGDARLVHL
ncbi:hypothetical protein [Streptosporangium sp. 'caverna']|uniref:hypothetical protein n=1 Tax=Streptosporangium sp. 'caverna' TaxID=2202249 RepID=UPI0013A6A14C|nr:hypothetical protein [Streptosporangium sp. 'caverna']